MSLQMAALLRAPDSPALVTVPHARASPSHPSHLQEDDEDKVDVGHAVELLVEVQREEGEDVVLGRLNGIALPK